MNFWLFGAIPPFSAQVIVADPFGWLIIKGELSHNRKHWSDFSLQLALEATK